MRHPCFSVEGHIFVQPGNRVGEVSVLVSFDNRLAKIHGKIDRLSGLSVCFATLTILSLAFLVEQRQAFYWSTCDFRP